MLHQELPESSTTFLISSNIPLYDSFRKLLKKTLMNKKAKQKTVLPKALN